MSDAPNDAKQSGLDKVLTAIRQLGEATAAAIAEQAGIGYSTTTPKLRALEEAGHAERFRNDEGRSLWRLTQADTAAVTATGQADTADGPGQPVDAEQTEATSDDLDNPAVVEVIAVDAPGEPEPEAADTSGPQPQPHTGPEIGPVDQPQPVVAEAADHTSPPGGGHAPTGQPATPNAASAGKPKRPKGTLRAAVLTLLQHNPATAYKVGEICKLLDQANEGTDANKASAGAVANALDKLAGEGSVKQVNERPATFQAE